MLDDVSDSPILNDSRLLKSNDNYLRVTFNDKLVEV
jgi:hypothetical protein